MALYKDYFLSEKHIQIILEGLNLLKGLKQGDANAAGEISEDFFHKDAEIYLQASSAEAEFEIEIQDVIELQKMFEEQSGINR